MSSFLGVCSKCKDDNLVLSKPRGSEFVLLKLLPISVYRCQNCHHRFKKMSKFTTYLSNIAYLVIFCLVCYVLFSQYELNKDDDYLSSVNKPSVEFDSAAKQKEITASVREAINLEEQLLNPNTQTVKPTSAQAQVSRAFEQKPMPAKPIESAATANQGREKVKQVILTKLEATSASDAKIEETALFQSSQPITNSNIVNKKDEVLLALASWRSAWQDQDFARYLASYSRKMKPKGGTFSQWAAKRKQRITKPKWIRVEINNPKVEVMTPQADIPQARVVFQQVYRASNFSDSSLKELFFRKEGGNWNILKETSL